MNAYMQMDSYLLILLNELEMCWHFITGALGVHVQACIQVKYK